MSDHALSSAFPGSKVAAGEPKRPRDMDRLRLKPDDRELLSSIALGIFVDMANAGQPFEACLRAIYLSGLENGRCATLANLGGDNVYGLTGDAGVGSTQ